MALEALAKMYNIITNVIQVVYTRSTVVCKALLRKPLVLKSRPVAIQILPNQSKIDARNLDLNNFSHNIYYKKCPYMISSQASCFPITLCTTASVTKRSIPTLGIFLPSPLSVYLLQYRAYNILLIHPTVYGLGPNTSFRWSVFIRR